MKMRLNEQLFGTVDYEGDVCIENNLGYTFGYITAKTLDKLLVESLKQQSKTRIENMREGVKE